MPSATLDVRPPAVEELPLLNPAVLQALEEQLGQSPLARNFADDYAGLWEQRQQRLVDALERNDLKAALDAAISLKVSSAMVGALRLAHLAGQLERAVRNDYPEEMARLLTDIAIHGADTVNELLLSSAAD
jgi:chemotaxis protein histidine kinase CheA